MKTQDILRLLVVYDKSIISYQELTKYFFEIYDLVIKIMVRTHTGKQYLSAIFYNTNDEKTI